ncbi:hypothetical protein [Stenotrophomonas maltophilia]|uniref:hypothetical protein n=1 Tax=Stenotrophomonas maltophilia TaxID=40324 RepID=UPI0034E24519
MDKKWIAISLLLLSACSQREQRGEPLSEPSTEQNAVSRDGAAVVDPQDSMEPRALPVADITTVVTCTGATLKMGDMKQWKKWVGESQRRFAEIYPDKTAGEIEAYTLERALDKRRELERVGIGTPRAFTDYFNKNCLGVIE